MAQRNLQISKAIGNKPKESKICSSWADESSRSWRHTGTIRSTSETRHLKIEGS